MGKLAEGYRVTTKTRIIGVLDAYSETGTEGIYWSVLDNNKDGYAALNIVEDGDYLFIEDLEGGIAWEGEIRLEYERNKIPVPLHPEHRKQQVFNFWVHGFQSDVEPETWATWFFEGRSAVLIKGDKECILYKST